MSTLTPPHETTNATTPPTGWTNNRNANMDAQPSGETIKDSDITPPKGWTNNPAILAEDSIWSSPGGDVKNEVLKMDFGLDNAELIWTQTPPAGYDYYVFRAEAGNPRKTLYYVYVASMYSVFSINAQGLEEIRDPINETGMGSLKGLKVVELEGLPPE